MENVGSDEVEIGSLRILPKICPLSFPTEHGCPLVISICVYVLVIYLYIFIYIYRRIVECCLKGVLVVVTVSPPTHHRCGL